MSIATDIAETLRESASADIFYDAGDHNCALIAVTLTPLVASPKM